MAAVPGGLGDGVRLAYGCIALFTSLLHNVFLLYHVQAFISVYRIDRGTFWFGEIAFLVWNSLNDPLFGWASDSRLLRSRGPVSARATLLRRVAILGCAGAALSATFLLFWFPWGFAVGLQFLVCLLLYDAFLTLVDLHHSALLAELTLDSGERVALSTWSAAGSALGASSVFLAYLTWRGADMAAFQSLCCAIAAVAGAGFIATSAALYARLRRLDLGAGPGARDGREDEKEKRLGHTTPPLGTAMLRFSRQLMRHRNFMWFSLMHLVQVFHCHFNSNFFPLFLHTLLAKSVSPAVASALMSVSFVLPHINNFYFLSACKRHGAYNVICGLFLIKLAMSVLMMATGYRFVTLLCIFIASNRIFTEGTCKLLTLVISDLVDEDTVLNTRPQPLSALIYGSAALLAKPGQTLAPLLGTLFLSLHTGRDVFQSGAGDPPALSEVSDTLRDACFHMLTLVSAGCALVQLLTWTQYRLRGHRLSWVKQVRAEGASYLRAIYPIV